MKLAPWLLWLTIAQPAQDLPEVRQLVTFKFSPGKTEEAVALFEERAIPLYQGTPSMLRFRGFRETESPQPLDLVVVSTFRGLAGMDASNRELRERAAREHTSLGAIYGSIGALSEHHRDELVEIDPEISWGTTDTSPLLVIVSTRIVPGKREELEALVRDHVVSWEKALGESITGAEGGPFLLSDGRDYVRFIGISSLGDWHRYVRERREQSFATRLESVVVASKEIIVAPIPGLAVR